MKKILIIIGLAIVIIGGSLYLHNRSTSRSPAAPGTLSVVTSFYPLYFFTSQIAGPDLSVYNVTPPGVEPHDYDLTSQDHVALSDSSLIVINGAGLEPWADKLSEGDNQAKILAVGDSIATATLTEDGVSSVDPHVWLSPALAKQMVAAIAARLGQIDPEHAADFANRAALLESRLAALDDSYRSGLSTCAHTTIVTAHAAFHYLAAAYGINQIAIAGLSPEAEPTPRALSELASTARKNQVEYIFFESLAPPDLANTLAREVGAKTLVLNPLEGLTPDEQAAGQDYFSVMQANLTNLRLALSCQ